MVLITRKNSSSLFALSSCTLQQRQELECGTFNIFLISMNEKHSLKSVIQNAEYEVGVRQNFFLQDSCSATLFQILEKYF